MSNDDLGLSSPHGSRVSYETKPSHYPVSNNIAKTFKIIAVIIWIVGGIVAALMGVFFDLFSFSIMAVSSFLSGLMAFGFGEIIQRLHNIDLNTRK